jgi:hypothetical protein
MPPTFYLGAHMPSWLGRVDLPLFVSHRRLMVRKKLPRASAPWALDSGGFTELSLYGEWRTSPTSYVAAVRRYRDEVGMLAWASPQDWMNEPAMLARTGLTVAEHQRRTVTNLLLLRELAPELPIIPVLQGWTTEDYLRCADLYETHGVALADEPLVGIGTVCRRQDTAAGESVVTALADRGYRLHGFGIKLTGLRAYGGALSSSDSMAWSFRGRRVHHPACAVRWDCRRVAREPGHCGGLHHTEANCRRFALRWREDALRAFAHGTWQPTLC